MGADEGISLGVKVFIAISICFVILTIYNIGRNAANKQTQYLSKVSQAAVSEEFSRYDNTVISGYELWDLLREKSGKQTNGNYFRVEIVTAAYSVTWTSDRSLANVVTTDQTLAGNNAPPYFISEDWQFNCSLITSDDARTNIVGVRAQLIVE